MNYERPYYEDINYHPLMFYVVFGAKEEELEISRERHNRDEIPEGLNINNAVANKLANPDKSKGKREFFFLSKNRPKQGLEPF